MNNHRIYPNIGKIDVIYTYKERFFKGFAPCFQDGMYSLACCKGAKNGRGMRQSVCKTAESGKTVWVLAIASGDIRGKNHNTSSICYAPGDAIYLAKIENVYTWKEYSTLDSFKKRSDSYYLLSDGRVEWRKKIAGLHDKQVDLERDCGVGASRTKKVSEAYIFENEKQILTSEEYYVFDKGQKISGIADYEPLDVGRGFSYIDKNGKSRIIALREFLHNNHSFYCQSGTDPFSHTEENEGGSCTCK